jgi:sulfur-oxidizing protein SoxB
VAGWASVNPQRGIPVWQVLAKHLAATGNPLNVRPDGVSVQGVTGNPGIIDQG